MHDAEIKGKKTSQVVHKWEKHMELWKELSRGILSYFGHGQKLLLKWRKPENNSLLRQKNSEEIIINHKGARIVKDRARRLARITSDELEKFDQDEQTVT